MNPKVIEGNLDARGLRFAIVVSRFNSAITERLLGGALDALGRTGVNAEDVEVVRVPGSWEMPLAIRAICDQKRHDAVIALGAVIRGDTPHFDYVAGQAAAGILRVSLDTGVPVIFGVLTTETFQQAMDRAGGKHGNKGWDAAMAAMEMAGLLDSLPKRDSP